MEKAKQLLQEARELFAVRDDEPTAVKILQAGLEAIRFMAKSKKILLKTEDATVFFLDFITYELLPEDERDDLQDIFKGGVCGFDLTWFSMILFQFSVR
jgi:hypothetical protein